MQTKLHQWAVADSGCRFDDLYNLVFDPATLQVAFCGSRAIWVPAQRAWMVEPFTAYELVRVLEWSVSG